MHPRDIDAVRTYLETQYAVVCLPRWNFWQDRKHVWPLMYPDYQGRCFRLDRGIRLEGKRHEGLNLRDAELNRLTLYATKEFIYHYGDIGANVVPRALKNLNVARTDRGLQPLDKHPNPEAIYRESVEFTEEQPLDPDAVGIYAPFEGIGEHE